MGSFKDILPNPKADILHFHLTSLTSILLNLSDLNGVSNVNMPFRNSRLGSQKRLCCRSLSPSEKNYPAHKLEFLALKWAIVDRLHDYLYGATVQVVTDNNPLTFVLTSAKLDATGHCWLAALSTYNFSLKYRPGRLS